MVIYAGQVEAEMDALQPHISQLIRGPLVNVPLGLNLAVIRESIHLVYEHLKLDALVHLVGACHCLVEPYQGFPVVVLGHVTMATHTHTHTHMMVRVKKIGDEWSMRTNLGIYDEDEGTTPTKDVL